MSPNLKIEGIAVGVLLIFSGILSVFLGIWSVDKWLEYMEPVFARENISIDGLSLITRFHLVFVTATLSVIAGILLLLTRTFGWTLGISICIYKIYILGITLFNFFDSSTSFNYSDSGNIIILFITLNILFLLLLLLSLVFFLLPKIRFDFRTGRNQYISALVLTLLIFADRLLL